MQYCVYGAQYGSEGKGCVSEFLIDRIRSGIKGAKVVALGDPGPNSGHTCSAGKVRCMPAASFFADEVVLCADSAIDLDVLATDLKAVRANGHKPVYVYENAGVVCDGDREVEREVVKSISSTGSGAGACRARKALGRNRDAVAKAFRCEFEALDVQVISQDQQHDILQNKHLLFECSQGLMLDLNFGIYPWVTARSTIPDAALARNGLIPASKWNHIAVMRTYPIRTGGPSGDSYGPEVSWPQLGVPDEIATVTGRKRRVFYPSFQEIELLFRLARPDELFITHLDYIQPAIGGLAGNTDVEFWCQTYYNMSLKVLLHNVLNCWGSYKPGQFQSVKQLATNDHIS